METKKIKIMCPTCDGYGKLAQDPTSLDEEFHGTTTCLECNGTGKVDLGG